MIATTEQVWHHLSTDLKSFIARRVPDSHVAEDILQDVFLKIHSRIDTLKDAARLEGWIYRITRNAISDYYRDPAARPTGELPELLAAPDDSEEATAARDLIPGVRSFIAQLPPDYRQAILLTEYGGLNQRQLAEKLGISVSGAKSRVQRAREKLKEMLLDCCHFELDRLGRIISYEPRCECCREGKCEPENQ
jgi:RNA polymerase sigma-70 factor, ECF subfamily